MLSVENIFDWFTTHLSILVVLVGKLRLHALRCDSVVKVPDAYPGTRRIWLPLLTVMEERWGRNGEAKSCAKLSTGSYLVSYIHTVEVTGLYGRR